jgi:hypothetical protein
MQKVFSLGHPPWKKQLMNVEQVVETSAQSINAGHGGLAGSLPKIVLCEGFLKRAMPI